MPHCRRVIRPRLILNAVACCALVRVLHAQMATAASAFDASNASWAKRYATDCGSAVKHPCPPSTNGYAGEFFGDPRFIPLLKTSLPQRESWWVNGYGGSAPVSSTVQQFLGIPGAFFVNEDRYVTVTGCVPHSCTTTGMLWVDTGAQPATVVFVGEDLVVGGKEPAGYHLYLYTSRALATYNAGKRDISVFPADFLRSLARWHNAGTSKYDTDKVVLATVVWPNGRSHDYFWSDLLNQSVSPDITKPGAHQ